MTGQRKARVREATRKQPPNERAPDDRKSQDKWLTQWTAAGAKPTAVGPQQMTVGAASLRNPSAPLMDQVKQLSSELHFTQLSDGFRSGAQQFLQR